ncbi:unnamed protein product [Rhizophagus irregularis]|nr:unnamed protein product [Rhizophagus irregularis]CAB4429298.1 unnamed protein product [Rhizophagus irregularis]
MFQLSRVAYQSLSHGLATGRVKVPQISKFNNTLKEDVKGLSKELSEDIGGTSLLTAIGWGFTLRPIEKKDSAESVGWVRNLPKSVPKK